MESRIKIDELNNEIIMGIYDGLSNNHNSNPIYFDIPNKDVGSEVQGYFSSNIGNQEFANTKLFNNIRQGSSTEDFSNRSRFIPIERMSFKDFIDEFLLMANNKEPYLSYSKNYCHQLEDAFDTSIDSIDATYDLQMEFGQGLMKKYRGELIPEFPNIWNFTTTNLSITWVINTFRITDPVRLKRSGRTWNM